jgi:hypothetical protein
VHNLGAVSAERVLLLGRVPIGVGEHGGAGVAPQPAAGLTSACRACGRLLAASGIRRAPGACSESVDQAPEEAGTLDISLGNAKVAATWKPTSPY